MFKQDANEMNFLDKKRSGIVVYLHVLVCLCGILVVYDATETTCEILFPDFSDPFGSGGGECFQKMAGHNLNCQRVEGELTGTRICNQKDCYSLMLGRPFAFDEVLSIVIVDSLALKKTSVA